MWEFRILCYSLLFKIVALNLGVKSLKYTITIIVLSCSEFYIVDFANLIQYRIMFCCSVLFPLSSSSSSSLSFCIQLLLIFSPLQCARLEHSNIQIVCSLFIVLCLSILCIGNFSQHLLIIHQRWIVILCNVVRVRMLQAFVCIVVSKTFRHQNQFVWFRG